MDNYFLEKFKEKTKKELQSIVNNRSSYQSAAVSAATQLLNERKDEQPLLETPVQSDKKETNSKFGVSMSFDYKPFFRTLSYREILTSLSLALLYHAFHETLNYYSSERLFEGSLETIKIVIIIALFLVNHVYYKFENNRSNNFIGRSISDLMFMVFLILTRVSYEFFLDSSYRLTFSGNVVGMSSMIFGVIILVFVFESLVAILKIILKYIRCRIF